MKFTLYFIFALFVSLQAFSNPFHKVRAVMFDMEGVLKVGETPIGGAAELIAWMEKENVPGYILTNEDQYTVEKIRADLIGMDINIPDSWKIYSAAEAMKDFVCQKLPLKEDSYFLVVGEPGLKETVKRASHPHLKVVDQLPKSFSNESLYIVVGTIKSLNDNDLDEAKLWAKLGAKVLVTCPDMQAPGSKTSFPKHILEVLSSGNNLKIYSTGKPNPVVVGQAINSLKKHNPTLENDQILFVGDTIDTDIKAALEFGMQSALVLSGNTSTEQVPYSIIQPDYIFSDVGTVLNSMQEIDLSLSVQELASQ